MNEEELFEVLNKWNFWKKEIYFGHLRKNYVNKVISFIDKKEVIVLKGIRRCGKSTIIKQVMYELLNLKINKNNIIYVNLEDYNFSQNLNLKLFDEILKVYKAKLKPKGKIYFFIDEIQNISGWEKWIRTYYDLGENIKFIVSGSCASLLSKELSTLLTGRNISFTISPISYKEAFELVKLSTNDYLEFGGFPEVIFEKNIDKKRLLLEQYFKDIIYKDIIDRYQIRNSKQLLSLATYLVSNPGTKISANKLAKTYGISKDTIQLYINYLVDTFILIEVPYFSYSAKVRHDISKLAKYYCIDNGLINIVTIRFSKNTGNLYENSVGIKLAKSYDEIFYFDDGTSEVDFIVDKLAINVTSTNEINEREIKGLNDFLNNNKNFKTLLIAKNTSKDKNIVGFEDYLLD